MITEREIAERICEGESKQWKKLEELMEKNTPNLLNAVCRQLKIPMEFKTAK